MNLEWYYPIFYVEERFDWFELYALLETPEDTSEESLDFVRYYGSFIEDEIIG